MPIVVPVPVPECPVPVPEVPVPVPDVPSCVPVPVSICSERATIARPAAVPKPAGFVMVPDGAQDGASASASARARASGGASANSSASASANVPVPLVVPAPVPKLCQLCAASTMAVRKQGALSYQRNCWRVHVRDVWRLAASQGAASLRTILFATLRRVRHVRTPRRLYR